MPCLFERDEGNIRVFGRDLKTVVVLFVNRRENVQRVRLFGELVGVSFQLVFLCHGKAEIKISLPLIRFSDKNSVAEKRTIRHGVRAIGRRFHEGKVYFAVFIRRAEVILSYYFKIFAAVLLKRDEVLRDTFSSVIEQFLFTENLFAYILSFSDRKSEFNRL